MKQTLRRYFYEYRNCRISCQEYFDFLLEEKIKRFWAKLDPDCSSKTALAKKMLKEGNLTADDDTEVLSSAFGYLMKDVSCGGLVDGHRVGH